MSNIRPARPAEARELTNLALRSKAHWGYDAAFMARAAEALTVTPEMISAGRVVVLEDGGGVAALYALSYEEDGTAELDLLFVEQACLGAGHGERLFAHAIEAARVAGARRLIVESDPNAAGFYARMSMTPVGERVSPVEAGRVLPVLALALD
ncbi:MAG TPA: GNAT family N-acetyltransferase [Alphaproteobacteria bacterium]|nr:GNAT family N-acetyltransferase [Alphaproteobacteria bacterium]